MTNTTAFDTWHKQYNAAHPVVTAEELVFAAFQAGRQADCPKLAGLKPCPFCGGQGQPALLQGGGLEWAQVECVDPECGAVGPTPATEAEAITAWNTRAADAIERLSPAVGVEELRAALEFYADPETYHGCAFAFDPPTGGFDDDFSGDHGHDDYDRPMPGKLARAALRTPTDAGEQGVTQAGIDEGLRRARRAVLEQRCERDTPWDRAVLACAEAILATATMESDHG